MHFLELKHGRKFECIFHNYMSSGQLVQQNTHLETFWIYRTQQGTQFGVSLSTLNTYNFSPGAFKQDKNFK